MGMCVCVNYKLLRAINNNNNYRFTGSNWSIYFLLAVDVCRWFVLPFLLLLSVIIVTCCCCCCGCCFCCRYRQWKKEKVPLASFWYFLVYFFLYLLIRIARAVCMLWERRQRMSISDCNVHVEATADFCFSLKLWNKPHINSHTHSPIHLYSCIQK